MWEAHDIVELVGVSMEVFGVLVGAIAVYLGTGKNEGLETRGDRLEMWLIIRARRMASFFGS